MARTKISEFSATPGNNTDIDGINLAEGCAPSGINDAIRELMSQLKDWQAGTSNDPMVIGSSGSLTLSYGTANGVPYLNGSKVLTTGSALTFDGTSLFVGATSAAAGKLVVKDTASSNTLWLVGRTSDGASSVSFRNAADSAYNARLEGVSGQLAFEVNGSEQMRLTSTGLGIGTSSPAEKLTVAGSVSSSSEFVIKSGTTAKFALGQTSDAFYIYSNAAGAERMRIDSSGNLGLGVTPSAWDSGFKPLQLGASGSFISGRSSNVSQIQVGANAYYNGTNWIYVNTNSASRYVQSGGEHQWFNAASGTAGDTITFTQAMTLDASGNLQLGTTTAKTTVWSGSGNGLTIGGASAPGLAVYDTTDTSYVGYIYQANADTAIGNNANGNLTFSTNNTERARIDSSGNLYINTTSAIDSAYKVQLYFASGGGITIKTGTNGDNAMGFRNSSGTSVGSIVINASSTAYNTSSDYRLKENIQPMTGALAKIAALKPCTYKWKADGSDGEGFIAHELAEVVPQCVTGEKNAVDADGKPVYQGIDTSFLVATLTAAIQEQQAIINQLKSRLDAANL